MHTQSKAFASDLSLSLFTSLHCRNGTVNHEALNDQSSDHAEADSTGSRRLRLKQHTNLHKRFGRSVVDTGEEFSFCSGVGRCRHL